MLKEIIREYIDKYTKNKIYYSGSHIAKVLAFYKNESGNYVADVQFTSPPFENSILRGLSFHIIPGLEYSATSVLPNDIVLVTFFDSNIPTITTVLISNAKPLSTPVTSASPVSRVGDQIQAGAITSLIGSTWTPGKDGTITISYIDGITGATLPVLVMSFSSSGMLTAFTPSATPVMGTITTGNSNFNI